MDSSEAVLAALIDALRADATLAALHGGRVYDAVLDNTDFPQGVVTVEQGEAYDGAGLQGWECIVLIDWWTQDQGRAVNTLPLAARAFDVLHGQGLTLTGHTLVNLRLASQRGPLRQADRKTRLTQQRFRIVTQPA